MFRLFECCALSFFERFVLSFSLKIERFVSDSAEIWICGLYMPVKLLEANPLAEEIRNQVVVKRGPLVYCLESMDIEGGHKIDNVLIPADIRLTPKKITIEGSPIVALDGTARLVDEVSWKDTLYREVGKADKPVHIRLIPYYAWGNRGKAEMTVWMPLARTNH